MEVPHFVEKPIYKDNIIYRNVLKENVKEQIVQRFIENIVEVPLIKEQL